MGSPFLTRQNILKVAWLPVRGSSFCSAINCARDNRVGRGRKSCWRVFSDTGETSVSVKAPKDGKLNI